MPNKELPLEFWRADERFRVVLRILRGELSAKQAADKHGLPVEEVEDWKQRFLSGAKKELAQLDLYLNSGSPYENAEDERAIGSVFFSYVREDQDLVDRVAAELRRRRIRVWLDRDSIEPGERWESAIDLAIDLGEHFVAFFSDNYSARSSTYMNEELTYAFRRLRESSDEQGWFIPVLLSGRELPDVRVSDESLQPNQLHYVDLTRSWDEGVNELAALLIDVAHSRDPEAFLLPVVVPGDMLKQEDLNLILDAIEYLEVQLAIPTTSASRFRAGQLITADDLNALYERIRSINENLDSALAHTTYAGSDDSSAFPLEPGTLVTAETFIELNGEVNRALRSLSLDQYGKRDES